MRAFIREIGVLLGLWPRMTPPPPSRRVAVCDRCGQEQSSGAAVCAECGGKIFTFHTAGLSEEPRRERRPNLWAWLALVALIYASVRIGGYAPLWNIGAVGLFGLTLNLLLIDPSPDWAVSYHGLPVGPSGTYFLCLLAGLMLLVPLGLDPPVDGGVAQAVALCLNLVLVLSPAARGER